MTSEQGVGKGCGMGWPESKDLEAKGEGILISGYEMTTALGGCFSLSRTRFNTLRDVNPT